MTIRIEHTKDLGRFIMARWQLFLASAWLAGSAAFVNAADWPAFRGAEAGVSRETGLPGAWDGPSGQGVAWKYPLTGQGISSPVVAGGKVFLTACTGYQQKRLMVMALSAGDGKLLWQRQFAATGDTTCHPTTNMAAPTPVAGPKGVYALFATGDAIGLSHDGDLLWIRSLVRDNPTVTNQVGMASSLALSRDTVLVSMENAGESFFAGLDASTGIDRWRLPRSSGLNWSSPLVIGRNGRDEALFPSSSELLAVEPESGKTVWKHEGPIATIASPAIDGGRLYAPGSPFVAFKPGAADEWKSPKLSTRHTSPVAVDGKLYSAVVIGVNCVDGATGQEVWQHRLKGPFSASLLAGDGKLYAINEEGVATVLALGGDKPKVLATNALGEKVASTPAISGGRLFIRGDKHLYCIAGR